MWRLLTVVPVLFVCASAVLAASPPAAEPQPDPQYERVIAERAAKIVAPLELADAEQVARVAGLIADQYRSLSALHARRDALRAAGDQDDAGRQAALQAIAVEQYQLHRSYLARLAAELPAAQIDQIKDGMTYGVVAGTYGRYLQLLPELTPDERRQIKAWLIEAREYAMDGGSSEEKHGWFRKYKGRITNYLSQRGYDLAAAERRLAGGE